MTQTQFTTTVTISAIIILIVLLFSAVEYVRSYIQLKELRLKAEEAKKQLTDTIEANIESMKHAMAGLDSVENEAMFGIDVVDINKAKKLIRGNIDLAKKALLKIANVKSESKVDTQFTNPVTGLHRVDTDISVFGVETSIMIFYDPKTYEVSSPMLSWTSDVRKNLSHAIKNKVNRKAADNGK